jgi:hypothetical protein
MATKILLLALIGGDFGEGIVSPQVQDDLPIFIGEQTLMMIKDVALQQQCWRCSKMAVGEDGWSVTGTRCRKEENEEGSCSVRKMGVRWELQQPQSDGKMEIAASRIAASATQDGRGLWRRSGNCSVCEARWQSGVRDLISTCVD